MYLTNSSFDTCGIAEKRSFSHLLSGEWCLMARDFDRSSISRRNKATESEFEQKISRNHDKWSMLTYGGS